MSTEETEIEQVAQRALDKQPGVVLSNAVDAANYMGLSVDASRDEVNRRFQSLVLLIHPDQSDDPNAQEAFIDLQNARDMLLSEAGERESESIAEEARAQDAPPSPGSGGWGPDAEEKQEMYRETFEEIKIFFVENILGIVIQADTLEEAIKNGEVTESQMDMVESTLREAYGVPELDLDDIARVLASLIVTGSIRLGSVTRMAERVGVFSGEGTGVFGRGSGTLGGRGTGVFK